MSFEIRTADRSQVTDIVRLLVDDALGRERERFEEPLPEAYYSAFDAIDSDPNNELVVAMDDGELAGIMQITYLPNMTYVGKWRAQIEGVRVSRQLRGRGIGRKLFEWAIARADERGCHLVQLTTDRSRPDAVAFYESLGFVPSHVGMKLKRPEVE